MNNSCCETPCPNMVLSLSYSTFRSCRIYLGAIRFWIKRVLPANLVTSAWISCKLTIKHIFNVTVQHVNYSRAGVVSI